VYFAKLDRTIPEWFAAIGRATEVALLTRHQQHLIVEPPPKRKRFDELLDKIDMTDEESCWQSHVGCGPLTSSVT
jgi:hypothetical protein